MQISSNNSLSFGSIQVGLSKMSANQRRISDRLFNSIKYSDKYSKLQFEKCAEEDLDIYILAKRGSGVEIRFMDPYSGEFVRKDNKIVKENLYGTVSETVEAVTDKIVDIYEKIVQGVIKRPKEDVAKFMRGETEMVRINPAKEQDLSETVKEYKKLGYSQEDAEEQAFQEYKALYHIENKDADF